MPIWVNSKSLYIVYMRTVARTRLLSRECSYSQLSPRMVIPLLMMMNNFRFNPHSSHSYSSSANGWPISTGTHTRAISLIMTSCRTWPSQRTNRSVGWDWNCLTKWSNPVGRKFLCVTMTETIFCSRWCLPTCAYEQVYHSPKSTHRCIEIKYSYL